MCVQCRKNKSYRFFIVFAIIVFGFCHAFYAFSQNKPITDKQVIVVTGASGDIGTAITSNLMKQGYFIVAHYNSRSNNLTALSKKYPGQCLILQSDFKNFNAISEFWEQAQKWKGHIDCLVNCAGTLDFVDISASDEKWWHTWENTLKVNLVAPSLLCKKACMHFLEKKRGMIINISSRTADNGYPLNGMHYAASKAGLKALSKSIAVTYGANNILCYTISPGCVDTKMVRSIDKCTLDGLLKEIPTNEFVNPQEIAELVSFICSGKIKNATGASFDLNGASYLR